VVALHQPHQVAQRRAIRAQQGAGAVIVGPEGGLEPRVQVVEIERLGLGQDGPLLSGSLRVPPTSSPPRADARSPSQRVAFFAASRWTRIAWAKRSTSSAARLTAPISM
jgi:hypothetical protein